MKADEIIAAGDFVMLKKQYKTAFPNVPARMGLKIESIQDGNATVVFIDFEANRVCKETLPISALSNAL